MAAYLPFFNFAAIYSFWFGIERAEEPKFMINTRCTKTYTDEHTLIIILWLEDEITTCTETCTCTCTWHGMTHAPTYLPIFPLYYFYSHSVHIPFSTFFEILGTSTRSRSRSRTYSFQSSICPFVHLFSFITIINVVIDRRSLSSW